MALPREPVLDETMPMHRRMWFPVPSRQLLGRLLIFIALLAAARLLRAVVSPEWVRVVRLGFGVALAIYLAALTVRLRNTAIVVASLLLCLAAIESAILVYSPPAHGYWAPGLSVMRPVLGWGPGHPGVFRHSKTDGTTGQLLFDVNYTIDEHLNRRVIAAPDGPAVAFFGDSFTFGHGVPDADTLPQAFADATDRRLRVINLGVMGYGPHQFLRALETGIYDDLLKPSRLFVFETAVWHAQRSACKFEYGPPQSPEPRYRLAGGVPEFAGTCSRWWSGITQALFTGSATYRSYVSPLFEAVGPADIDLYVAILVRAGELARERYGVPTAILYLPYPEYARQAGTTDAAIMQRLRDGGLVVIDGTLDPSAFPGQPLLIPGDGHPTAVANRARALLVRDALEPLLRLPAGRPE